MELKSDHFYPEYPAHLSPVMSLAPELAVSELYPELVLGWVCSPALPGEHRPAPAARLESTLEAFPDSDPDRDAVLAPAHAPVVAALADDQVDQYSSLTS